MHHAREVICLDRCSPSSASSSCFSSCAGSSRMAVAAECPVVLPRVPGKSVWKNFPPGARRKTADPFGKALRSRHACVSLPFPRCLDPGSGSPVHVPRPVVSCDGLFLSALLQPRRHGACPFPVRPSLPHLLLVRYGLPHSRRTVFSRLRWLLPFIPPAVPDVKTEMFLIS